MKIFFHFGQPRLLQSDNGKEFTAQVIKDLKIMWPGLIIINGRPRHPQSQGLVERGNSTLCEILGKFMQDRNTSQWVSCLGPTIYSMNTSIAQGIKHTPFEVVYGQKPRIYSTLWQSIEEQGIEDEDDLPSSIKEQLDEELNGTAETESMFEKERKKRKFSLFLSLASIVTSSSSSNIEPIKEQINSNVLLNAASEENFSSSSSSISMSTESITADNSSEKKGDGNARFDESSSSNLGIHELPHMEIRKKAAHTYLARTTRQQAAHRVRLQSLKEKCAVGEFVGLRIDKVDRTNTDPKTLPCMVIEQKDEQAKLACVYGILNQWWPLDALEFLLYPKNIGN